ncbi:hypothetical protein QVM41_16000, partial [Pseudomonas shirazica]
MQREAIEQALALKSSMQAAIDTGEIENRQQLMELAASHNLAVTRNGIDYAGFMCASGKRFRVHFNFNDRPVKEKRVKGERKRKITTGFWIYVSGQPTHLQNPSIKGDGVHLKIRGH